MGFLIKAWFFLMFWAIVIGGPLLLISDGPDEDILDSTVYDWARDLPIELAQNIIQKYSQTYHIIQVTRQSGYILDNIERLDKPLSNVDLVALTSISQKRILIDSCIQHISASLRLSSNVFWIGTNPKVFGYKLHNNIIVKQPNVASQLINSYTFDYNFSNNSHECPYLNINEMFDIPQVLDSLGS